MKKAELVRCVGAPERIFEGILWYKWGSVTLTHGVVESVRGAPLTVGTTVLHRGISRESVALALGSADSAVEQNGVTTMYYKRQRLRITIIGKVVQSFELE